MRENRERIRKTRRIVLLVFCLIVFPGYGVAVERDEISVKLKEHIELLVRLELKAIEKEFAAHERALILARDEALRQYAHLNNLKSEVKDERANMAATYERRFADIENRMSYYMGALIVLVFAVQIGVQYFLKK
jgi:hypothetical protein